MLFNRRKAEIEVLSSLRIDDMSQSRTAEMSLLGEIGNSRDQEQFISHGRFGGLPPFLIMELIILPPHDTDCGPIVTSNDKAHADQKLCISETEFVNMDLNELATGMSSTPDHRRGSGGGARNGLFVYLCSKITRLVEEYEKRDCVCRE